MDEHTVYKSQPIQRMDWTQPFYKKGLGLSRKGLIPSLNPALSTIYKEKINRPNNSALVRLAEDICELIERAGAGQWRFKKDVIDKWISEQSLERVTQNIKPSAKKKIKRINNL